MNAKRMYSARSSQCIFILPVFFGTEIILQPSWGQEEPLVSLWLKIEDRWNADAMQFLRESPSVVEYNHSNWWPSRLAGSICQTRFGRSYRMFFLSLVSMIDHFQRKLYHLMTAKCFKACEDVRRCRIHELAAGARLLAADVKLYAYKTRFHSAVHDPKGLCISLYSVLEDCLSTWLFNNVHHHSSECSSEVAPEFEVTFSSMARCIAAINMYANVYFWLIYNELITRVFLEAGRHEPRKLVFDMVGGECLGWICDSKVELGKALLSRVSTAPVEFLYVAEIGTYLGGWSLRMVEDVGNVVMLAVDQYDCERDCYPQSEGAYDVVHAKAAPFRDRYQLISQTSSNASRWVANGILSLLFVDAEHTYEACTDDVHSWAPKVRSGGVIMFHDYNPVYHDVMRCILESHDQIGVGPLYVSLANIAYFYV